MTIVTVFVLLLLAPLAWADDVPGPLRDCTATDLERVQREAAMSQQQPDPLRMTPEEQQRMAEQAVARANAPRTPLCKTLQGHEMYGAPGALPPPEPQPGPMPPR